MQAIQSANMVESDSGKVSGFNFSTEQVEILRQLLNQTKVSTGSESQNSKIPNAAMAQTGKISQTFLSKSQQAGCWIVDTGASDHVTGSMNVFEDYDKCKSKINVWVADGKMSPAVGKGTVCLPNMILKLVLYVSKLTYNLFSVSKLTKDMNCVVTFFSSHGEFQDRSLGKMIGIAERKDGLYYFSGVGDSGRVKSQNKMFTSVVSHSDIMLWHHRLGHPSYSYMKVLYPNLFVNKEKVSFQCQYCVLLNNPESIICHIHTNPQNLFN